MLFSRKMVGFLLAVGMVSAVLAPPKSTKQQARAERETRKQAFAVAEIARKAEIARRAAVGAEMATYGDEMTNLVMSIAHGVGDKMAKEKKDRSSTALAAKLKDRAMQVHVDNIERREDVERARAEKLLLENLRDGKKPFSRKDKSAAALAAAERLVSEPSCFAYGFDDTDKELERRDDDLVAQLERAMERDFDVAVVD